MFTAVFTHDSQKQDAAQVSFSGCVLNRPWSVCRVESYAAKKGRNVQPGWISRESINAGWIDWMDPSSQSTECWLSAKASPQRSHTIRFYVCSIPVLKVMGGLNTACDEGMHHGRWIVSMTVFWCHIVLEFCNSFFTGVSK